MSHPPLVIHVPVIHRGYLELLRRIHPEIGRVWIIGDTLVKELRFFEADISAMAAADAKLLVLAALDTSIPVDMLETPDVPAIRSRGVILVSDELSRRFAERYLPGKNDIRWESVFLRWDESYVASANPVNYGRRSREPFDHEMMMEAYAEAAKSSDWWRQVGAVVVRDGAIIGRAYNRPMPDEQSNYRLGDIRDYLKPGEHPDLSTAIHAEARLIAEAARSGERLLGAHLYATHFPCPMCAKAIACSGITTCFFGGGSANFDAELVLRGAGIELVHVPRNHAGT